MEFWGVEVKSGQPLDVKLQKNKVLHLSQAALGEIKKDQANESVCLSINIEGKKLVLGTLNSERLPQQLFDLVFDKEFKLSHNWKNGSVYFYGYIADQSEEYEESDDFDSEDDIPVPTENGNQELKKDDKEGSEKTNTAKASGSGKQKVKIVEPAKEIKPDAGNDSDDEDDDSDDAMSEDSDTDEDNDDSSDDDSDDEDSDEDEEETPKKQQSEKKRAKESNVKTPGNNKKAKLVTPTPQKTDGKKGSVHVATPHPAKKGGKEANKSNQKSPASEGAYTCTPCKRSFKTENALQSHNQAKHK